MRSWADGIGQPAVALQLARGGDRVLFVGRNADRRREVWPSCAGLPGADVVGWADKRTGQPGQGLGRSGSILPTSEVRTSPDILSNMDDTSTSLDEQPPMKDGIFVRRELAEDLEPALAVWWRAEVARRHGPPPSASVERVCDYARRTGVFLLVAESTGEVAGMALVTPATSRPTEIAVVQMVFVAPECWGEGIGGRLVDAALAEARVRGFEWALLWTHADDERVRRLYEGRGFGRTGPRVAGESGEPIVSYERPL